MKTTLALLAFASLTVSGCATQSATQDQALNTPSKVIGVQYDASIAGPRRTQQ
jgi:outer membrane lipoprotein-sorting protein